MTSGAFFSGLSPSSWFSSRILDQYYTNRSSPSPSISGSTLNTLLSSSRSNESRLGSLSGLYSHASNIINEADQLSSDNANSVFYQQSANSSNSNTVEIADLNVKNTDNSGSDISFEFDVSQLAQAQINKGTGLAPNEDTTISAGSNQFSLTVGSNEHTLSFSVNSDDTNETAINEMANAINEADIGVTASVVDGANETAKLKLTGETGTSNSFSLSDVSGNAVSASGANSSVQSTADALYDLDGASYTRADNSLFLLNGRLQVDLVSTGKATITVSQDTEAMVDAVSSMADTMNNLSNYLASNTDISNELSSKWSSLIAKTTASLGKYGLEVGPDAHLNVDVEELNSAIQDDIVEVREALGGTDGFASQISQMFVDTDKLSSAIQENVIEVREVLGGKSGFASQIKPFAIDIISSPGAALLESSPSSAAEIYYFRTQTSAKASNPGSSTFSTMA